MRALNTLNISTTVVQVDISMLFFSHYLINRYEIKPIDIHRLGPHCPSFVILNNLLFYNSYFQYNSSG